MRTPEENIRHAFKIRQTVGIEYDNRFSSDDFSRLLNTVCKYLSSIDDKVAIYTPDSNDFFEISQELHMLFEAYTSICVLLPCGYNETLMVNIVSYLRTQKEKPKFDNKQTMVVSGGEIYFKSDERTRLIRLQAKEIIDQSVAVNALEIDSPKNPTSRFENLSQHEDLEDAIRSTSVLVFDELVEGDQEAILTEINNFSADTGLKGGSYIHHEVSAMPTSADWMFWEKVPNLALNVTAKFSDQEWREFLNRARVENEGIDRENSIIVLSSQKSKVGSEEVGRVAKASYLISE